jgi:PBSX family phage portal protein
MTADVSFTFGEPELVTSLLDALGIFYDDFQSYYTPPISMKGLDTLSRANATHRRCINFKTNQAAISFVDTGVMSLRGFRRSFQDLETFGNVYAKGVFNGLGGLVRLEHLPALNMRKGKNDTFKMLVPGKDPIEFKPGEVFHTFHYDTGQTIYGLPQWIASIHDIFLNSEATLFRRRYYKNGSHMGYILYTTDPSLDPEMEKKIQDAVKNGKGVGNFRSMYINIPGGKEKAVQVIPIGDISQKDEFSRVKEISANDIIVGHGVPPILAGMKPDNPGGFGDIEKIERFYRAREVPALVHPFIELNDLLPKSKQFKFDFTSDLSVKTE